MFHVENYNKTKEENYELVQKQLQALIDGEPNFIANLSNASALLNVFFADINWVGFYLFEEETNQLVLGPFQGLPACIRIPIGRGVCGTAAANKETVLVKNVHEFPGHIACDAASNSEIVVPMMKDGKLIGVLDIDSPTLNYFQPEDKIGLEKFIEILLSNN